MKKNLLVLLLMFLGFLNIQSQEYLRMIEAGTYPVEEIIDSAESYFEIVGEEKGTGYIQFKRWEYMAKRLMNEDGYLPAITENIEEIERYNAYLNETAGDRQPLTDNWTDLGPSDWNATTGWNPGVGRIRGISVDPNDHSHIIVGAESGGIWKTTDGGASWSEHSRPSTSMICIYCPALTS